jgi:hypothetical protein
VLRLFNDAERSKDFKISTNRIKVMNRKVLKKCSCYLFFFFVFPILDRGTTEHYETTELQNTIKLQDYITLRNDRTTEHYETTELLNTTKLQYTTKLQNYRTLQNNSSFKEKPGRDLNQSFRNIYEEFSPVYHGISMSVKIRKK